ncbi:MAG: hypothetical protein F4Z82_18375 [Caldilineaceae bacterium SB0668_bin_21]|nr:hypothetical protein [Caldilineaceae bacterium SB0668_bin_21]MYC19928.1 hypothetical protein [Caldilineaceae bacterium SB0662_bin_25]
MKLSGEADEQGRQGSPVLPGSFLFMTRFSGILVAEEVGSMGRFFDGRATGRRLREGLRERTRFYRWENFPIHCAAQAVVVLMLVHYRIETGSLPAPVFLIGALLFSILFWRVPTGDFRRNQLHLAAQSLIAGVGFVQEFLFIYLFLLLVGQAVLLFRTGQALLWIGAYSATALWGMLIHHVDTPLMPAATTVLVAAGFSLTAILSDRIAYERRVKRDMQGLLTEISEANARLREYVGQRRFLAVVAEHNRLARALHNALGHRLTVAIVQVEGASRLMGRDPSQTDRMLQTVHRQLTAGLEELRDTIKALSTPEINADNLTPALRQQISEFSQETGIVVRAQLTEVPEDLPESHCLTVYRAVQEGLSNMRDHSEAANIWLNLDVAEDRLILTMRHDGEAFDPSLGYGYGLPGMQERALQIGGTFRVTRPAPGEVLVTFTLPIGERAREGVWSSGE